MVGLSPSINHKIAAENLKSDPNSDLKKGIWVYFLLLIFEGALRKWFLPGLAAPLLIIRDPLALAIIYLTWKQGLLPKTNYLLIMVLVGCIAFVTTIFFGHGNIAVAVFGARILLIQFPLIFAIGNIFNKEDVIQLGRVALLISIPMVILIGLQFNSPQSAWVNRGVGGDLEGAGFSGALGFYRPPGTFSFTNGTHLFFGFVASYVFYFWLNPKLVNKIILIASTASVLAAIPFSISRSLFFHVIIALFFATTAAVRKPQYLKGVLIAGIGGFVALLALNQTGFFQTSLQVFLARFETANTTEGGFEGVFLDRYLGGLIGALSESAEQPFFGHGIGMGTNVGSQLLTGGRSFLISEGEWGRLIGEIGPIMGLVVILLRLSLCVKFVSASYKKLVAGDMLPWMLLSFCLLILPQGGWAQPTSLGFSTLIAGLVIASFQDQNIKNGPHNSNDK